MAPQKVSVAHVWSSDLGVALALPRLRHFVARGWQVFAIVPDGPRLTEVKQAGVVCLPLRLSRRMIDPIGDLIAATQIVTHCRRYSFALVHTHNIKAGLVGRVAAGMACASKIVHTMHGMAFDGKTPMIKRSMHVALERMACRFTDRILVQSKEDERTVLEHRLISPERVVRIGNGIQLDRFDPRGIDRGAVRKELGVAPNDVLFFSAGRLVREKGFVELIEAFGIANKAQPNIRLAIAGSRDVDKSDCLSTAELQQAEEAGVQLLGERSDMPALYAASDVVVLPSWREGLPRVLIEGAAMGRVLLASDARGCREVVHADGGLVIPVRSVDSLATAMLDLARRGAWRKQAGDNNRRRALEHYDMGSVIARIAAVYHELLGFSL